MAGRRWRRVSRPQNLLPLQHAGTPLSPALSCWYCDFKTVAFNSFVYSLGCKHARALRVWYAIGVVFSLVTLIGVTLLTMFCIYSWSFLCMKLEILLWEVTHSILLGGFYMMRSNLSVNWFFGIIRLSLLDAAIMVYSTLAAVTVHEFGHALAAASQGIQVEYVAIFWALIFPGAFVAFNYDVLHNSFLSALRVYCAGIWHNAVFCAICALTLLFLPTILHPFYMHGKSPVVVDVAPASPLSGYLSRGDIITSLDGAVIHSPHEWREMFGKMGTQYFYNYLDSEANGIKGYCVSNSWLDKSNKSQSQDLSCPDELATFVKSSCSMSSPLKEGPLTSTSNTTEWKHCLSASDVVKLQKCGDGWKRAAAEGVCACLEDESCMAPVQSPGLAWVEISFKKPHSSECLNSRSDGLSLNLSFSLSESSPCGGTFVFVGNADSLLDTVLSAYNPRWMTGGMVLYFPVLLERVLSCMLHISASLALFNCLPAFFLDGESIMETCILSITWLRPRLRRRFTKLVLYGGSILTIYVFLQVLFVVFRKSS